MRHTIKLGLVFLAVLAPGTGLASAAEGELLNAKGTYATADTGTATFEGTGSSIVVKCKSSKGGATATNNISGNFAEHFKECTAAGIKCTGLHAGEATGEISMFGSYELLAFKEGTELKLGMIYSIEPVHFECAGILTTVRGSVIGEILNSNNEFTFAVQSLLSGAFGKERITTINGVNHHLESSTGGSAYVESQLTQFVSASGATVEVMY